MVNRRAKIKKTRNSCLSQPSATDSEASDHGSSTSAYLIGCNKDLLTEILVRLPATSILVFKSVSKHWQSLLTHPRFILRHDKLSISLGLFIRNKYVPFDVQDRSPCPDLYTDRNVIRILQSCNGLLLCCSNQGHTRDRKHYVLNPTTKQFAIIPSVPGGVNTNNICFVGLAFHQTSCPRYKVVYIRFRYTSPGSFRALIYSSDNGKWTTVNIHISEIYDIPFGTGVYWNGAIHWAPSCAYPSYFDLNGLKPQRMPLPTPFPVRVASVGRYGDGYLPLYFGESRGHLHLVDTACHESRFYLNVYEMLEDHSGWFVKYEVELDDLPGFHQDMIMSYQHPSSPHFHKFKVIDVVRCQEDKDTFMVLRFLTKIVRYNIRDKSFKQLFNRAYPSRAGHTEVHRYVQSLSSF